MTVSQHDIAKAAGVSQRAVSFALNGKPNVSKEKRAEILKVASNLGYRVNASARAMRRRSTGAIGVLVQHYNTGSDFLLGINQVLQETEYCTVVEHFSGALGLNDVPSRMVIEKIVDGLIIINSDTSLIDMIRGKFSSLINQIVWLESSYYADFGCIQRDEKAICQKAIEHLVHKQVQRVVYIDMSDDELHSTELNEQYNKSVPYHGGIHYSNYHRHAGIKECCQSQGIEFVKVRSHVHDKALPADELAAFVKTHDGKRTAVVSYDYRLAEWTFRQLAMAGLICPIDYGLISLDNIRTFQQEQFWHGLTRMNFDRVHAGTLAANMMLDMVRNKRQSPSIHIDGELVDGQTLKY